MPHVVIVSGNPAKVSRLNGLTGFVKRKLAERHFAVDVLHVADLPPEDLFYAKMDSPAVTAANELIAKADAVVFATPVYKASYTGVLKTFLDLLPQRALEHKVVLPLLIGGSIAHLLAVEYALKPVLSVLGARIQLAGVYAVDQWIVRAEDGGYDLKEELVERLSAAVEDLTAELCLRERGKNREQTV